MKKTMIINNDSWDIYFNRIDTTLVLITACLKRPNKKWYQKKYLYENWTYTDNLENLSKLIENLTERYYKRKRLEKEFDNFFNKPIDI